MSRQKPQPVALLAALVDIRLTGAACAGHAPLFDDILDEGNEPPEEREARHHQARSICRRCPVAAHCETAANEDDTTSGIWAGRLQGLTDNRRKAS
ncbi:WhiB family transcriptional regulator [Rhodococcus sp. IEGM 1379]|uniref:WhiB family transcriptional regulator n=1 Tax=Rhodococcus sp. IEGM 1379 TaxID=3047086 RepID=UPI0024B82704|nr:WhiB family transcriptional regulator [Rhodococcus sp. IEGM 1379]MDI9917859.1 WhiB family transcriptional regulator [Rhodococcus sp. IEGM 1379]